MASEDIGRILSIQFHVAYDYVSLYFAAQAVSVLQWSRLSDKVGRKPVLLGGLLGTIISSLLFGLSHSFWALVFRCVVQVRGMVHSNLADLAVA